MARLPPVVLPSPPGSCDGGKDLDLTVIPESWLEPRCHVCMSKHRKAIDRMIAYGTNYTEISRIFGGEIDRRSIANHAQKHLGYEDAAVRKIIEDEARDAEENAELGIQGALMRRVFLNTALQKAFEALVNGQQSVETRDAVAIIETLEKLERQSSGAQLDEIKMQFAAFIQAIKEVASARGDVSLGSDIFIRAREIVGAKAPEVLDKSNVVE
jgi:hypothetical protein